MRILYIHERFGFVGGVEQNVYDTASALVARGHVCHLLTCEGTGRDEERFLSPFEGHKTLWAGKSPTADEVQRAIQESSADVIYAHKLPSTAFVKDIAGVRTVRAIHDHDVTCPRRHKYFAWTGHCCSLAVGPQCYADLACLDGRKLDIGRVMRVQRELPNQGLFGRVVANSESMAAELSQNGVPAEKVSVLHPVVPEPDDAPTPLPEAPNLLYVGQVIRGKGPDLLLRALKRVHVNWKLTIAGVGNMMPTIEKLIVELGLSSQVDLRGWTPTEEVRRLYDTARVVVVPSRWPEPFGMIGIEAMRRARPVVAFGVGGIVDWLQDGVNGRVVPEQDLDAFASAVTDLLVDYDSARRMGLRGHQIANNKFGFEQYITRLEKVLS